jgi:hypothetical protein
MHNKIIIKLEGASIESPKIKNVHSKYLRSLTITPLKNKTQIVAFVPSNVKLIASKTADSYGLRLRFIDKTSTTLHQTNNQTNTSTLASSLPTKKDGTISQSYYIVIGFLFFSILILLYFKKKMSSKKSKEPFSNAWPFQPNTSLKPVTPQEEEKTNKQAPPTSNNEVSIRFQKVIDEKNSVVMIDFGIQSYLVLMGNGNILLDKFIENKPSTQQEFESILQSRHEELEDFLHGSKEENTINYETQEALQTYKEKASSSIYDTAY